MAPAMNIFATERPVIHAMIIMVLLGGMIIPTVELVALIATEKDSSYPLRFISGMRMPPTDAASATEEPDTPASSMLVTTDTHPRPPGS